MNKTEVSHTNTTSDIAKLILDQDDWGAIDGSRSVDQDLDELSFTPITAGLGFSKPIERINTLKNKAVARAPSKEFKYIDRPVKNKKEMLRDMSSRALETNLSDDMAKTSHLAAFYDKKPEVSKKKTPSKKRKLISASLENRLAAWVIDSVVITIMLLGFFGAIAGLLEINFSEVLLQQGKGFLLSCWSLLYIIYFTVLDLDRSFGKSVLRIKIIKLKAQISIIDTFVRTTTSLVSLLCFGIPLLFDLHGHLSDTKVIKWK